MSRPPVAEAYSRRTSGKEYRAESLARPPGGEPRGAAAVSTTTRARFGAAIVAIAPAVLVAVYLYHPHIPYLPDAAAVAAAVSSDTTRWGVAHLAFGVGSGFLVLAFVAIRGYLREAGEERWSVLAIPFIVMSGSLYALLPGLEFAVLAAAKTGADVEATQAALGPWFVPILFTGAAIFALGALAFAKAIAGSRVLTPPLTSLVTGSLVVMAAARFVPFGAVQFYVGGAAGVAALWPLAYQMWKDAEAAQL